MVKSARIAMAVIAPLVLLAILLVGVHAQSAFPTTPILDNFNRENESPATGWNHTWGYFDIVSNVALNSTEYDVYSYPNIEPISDDQEAYVTIISIGDPDEFSVLARFTTVNEESSGYMALYSSESPGITLIRMDDDVPTVLDIMTHDISNGDSIGIRCISSTISAWYKASGGTWEELGSEVDDTYSSGEIGLNFSANNAHLDNFGGGSYQEIILTPTPSIVYNSVATITLSSGEVVAVNYSYTFGDMGVIAVVLMMVVLTGVQFVYGITVKIWEWRDRR